MNRYEYGRWLGAALLALGVGALAATYPTSPALGVQMTAFTATGLLFVLAGTETRVRDRVGPHRLLGAGDVLLGASLLVAAVANTGDGDTVYVVATLLGGASLSLIGLAYVFQPGVFDLGPDGYPTE